MRVGEQERVVRVEVPLAGAYWERMIALGARYWVGYSDEELIAEALRDERLFGLVWGLARPRPDGEGSYVEVYEASDGERRVKWDGAGMQRVVRRMRRMRQDWAGAWRIEVGLGVVEGDGIADRIYNAELFRVFGERLVGARVEVEWEGSGSGSDLRVNSVGGEGVGVDEGVEEGSEESLVGAKAGVQVGGKDAGVHLPVRLISFEWARNAGVHERGCEATEEWGNFVRGLVGRLGIQGSARWLVRRAEYLGRSFGFAPGAMLGMEVGDGEIPERLLAHCRREVSRYVRRYFDGLEVGSRASRAMRAEPAIGAGWLGPFGGGKARELVGVQARSFLGMPGDLRLGFTGWVARVTRAFRELCSVKKVTDVPELSKVSAEFFRVLGFRFDEGVDIRFVEGWSGRLVEQVFALSAGKSGYGAYRDRMRELVVEVVRQHMSASGLRREFRVESVEDSLFGKRPGLVGGEGYWEQAEAAVVLRFVNEIGRSVNVSLSGPPSVRRLDWEGVEERRSFADRWVNDVMAKRSPDYHSAWLNHRELGLEQDKVERGLPEGESIPEVERTEEDKGVWLAYSWMQGCNDQWAKGVVCLEGALRGYLRYVGMGLSGVGGKGVGAFWEEIGAGGGMPGGFDVKPVLPWRWYLLREAYLVGLAVAWAEFLYGDWSPFHPTWLRRFRRSLSLYSAMVGVNGRSGTGRGNVPVRVPYWEGSPLGLEEGTNVIPEAFMSYVGGDFMGLDAVAGAKEQVPDFDTWDEAKRLAFERGIGRGFRYAGEVFVPDFRSMALPGEVGPETVPVSYFPVVGGLLPSSFRGPGRFIYERGEKRWKVGGRGSGFGLFGLTGRDNARAFQMVGNWFVAGQSRYASLRVGKAFSDWVAARKLPAEGVSAWGQFGILDSEEWRCSPGLGALFGGLSLGGSLSSFRDQFKTDGFDTWTQLGSEELLKTWGLVERSPLAFPMAPFRTLCTQFQSGGLPVAWLDRLLRAVCRGADPVHTQFSLVDPPSQLVGEDKDKFMEWRARIWAPVLRVPLEQLPQRASNILEEWDWPNGCFTPAFESLWRDWLRPWAQGRSTGMTLSQKKRRS